MIARNVSHHQNTSIFPGKSFPARKEKKTKPTWLSSRLAGSIILMTTKNKEKDA